MSGISFKALDSEAHGALRLALEAAGLPTDDLHQPDRVFFELAEQQGVIGFIGLEGSGTDRLLRSLVVLPGCARQGYSRLLVSNVEIFARRRGVERLHLLTNSAADFFRARGFNDGDRAAAPTAISQTAQFASLCPASAAYLVKEIA